MNKIPTAQEFLEERATPPYAFLCENIIEFAKLHVEAALKEADVKGSEFMSGGANYEEYQQAVLNSYPLENIK